MKQGDPQTESVAAHPMSRRLPFQTCARDSASLARSPIIAR
jgi:hypothetical protein